MVNALFLLPLTSFSLGIWQLNRLTWKENLIKIHNETLAIKPTSIEEIKSAAEFTKFTLNGNYELEKTIKVHRAKTLNDKPTRGFLLFTLFNIKNGGKVVVNRGWVPKDFQSIYTGSQDTEINVMKRNGEKDSIMTSTGKIEELIMIDLNLIKQNIGGECLVEVYGSNDKFPLSREHEFKNDHFQYAMTWFGLSFATLAMLVGGKKKKIFSFRK
jgi:surfeit locus 1 family protein